MKPKKIVTIGGGTGQFVLLSGLKKYPYDLTAIVSMADDGGSTGVLRDELGVLPPGDVRQCLAALSDSSEMLRRLMNYRFEGGGLKGHSFGNLFLSALEKITGDFSLAVTEATKILNVRGAVLPVSKNDMRLKIILENGKILEGEKELDDNEDIKKHGIHTIELASRVSVNPDAVKAISAADFVVIGPGDHFGSILPNVLVTQIASALKKTKGKVIFVAPMTNKRGHTGHFDVVDYVTSLETRIGAQRIDYVLYNTKKPDKKVLEKYKRQEGEHSLVLLHKDKKADCHYRVVSGDFLRREKILKTRGDAIGHTRAFIRHDSEKLARGIGFIVSHGTNHHLKIT